MSYTIKRAARAPKRLYRGHEVGAGRMFHMNRTNRVGLMLKLGVENIDGQEIAMIIITHPVTRYEII